MTSAGVHSLSHSPVIQAASSFSSMAPSRSVLFNFGPVKCRLRGVSKTTCVCGGWSIVGMCSEGDTWFYLLGFSSVLGGLEFSFRQREPFIREEKQLSKTS